MGLLSLGTMPKCEFCGLENQSSYRCRECGTILSEEQKPVPTHGRRFGETRVRRGTAWLMAGGVLTIASYAVASLRPNGGTYIICYGAIIYGVVEILRGLGGVPHPEELRPPDPEDEAYEKLATGTRFEKQGNAVEAMTAYRSVIEEYPGTRAARDAQMSLNYLESRLE